MNTVQIVVSLLNDAAVSIFGGVLSAAFCGALDTRRCRLIFWLGMALMLIPQGMVYLFLDARFKMEIYPLILHFPLLVLLRILTGKWLWPLISILSAYLFCQIRRWLALFSMAVLQGDDMTQKLTELVITLPLLLLLLHFAAPAFRQLMEYPVKNQCQFGSISAMYYAFDYLSRVYTDLLSTGAPVVVEFMPTVCGVAYLCFLAYNSTEERKRSLLQQTQDNLTLQISQATREISSLRESQAQASRYRHDLRHHMQYLLSCIENGRTDMAQDYIAGICAELESQRVQRYCENETVNLILSAFAARAEKAGIAMKVQGNLPAVLTVSDNDLCVILSNALENALHACLPLAASGKLCEIQLRFHSEKRTGKLLFQISNPSEDGVLFEKGLPVSRQPGHGIGTKSIYAIVERYRGCCAFLVENGQFILRVCL